MYAHFLDNAVHGEDAVLIDDPLFVLCDGVSTSKGKLAAQTVIEQLRDARKPAQIRQALLLANKELEGKQAQTTVVGVLKRKTTSYIFSVGDSSVIRIGKKNTRLLRLDTGDKPEYVTQIIGDGSYKLHEKTVRNGLFLLMSDGVSDNIPVCEFPRATPQKIVSFVQEKLAYLKKAGTGCMYGAYKEDDASLIVISS